MERTDFFRRGHTTLLPAERQIRFGRTHPMVYWPVEYACAVERTRIGWFRRLMSPLMLWVR